MIVFVRTTPQTAANVPKESVMASSSTYNVFVPEMFDNIFGVLRAAAASELDD